MFSSFASSIIGFLIAALSTVGGNATITVSSTDTASTTQPTSTVLQVDDTFLTGLANALVRLQTRFERGNSGRSGRDHSSDDNSSASSSNARHDSDDDSDDDEDDHSGRRGGDTRQEDRSVKLDSNGQVEFRGHDDEDEFEVEVEHGIEIEVEHEDEDEDEDEHRNRGGSTSGSAGASGSTGTSGNGSSSSGGTTPTNTQTALTMSVVAAHNTSASCYSAINGSVYDLTSWISQHPGGQSAIKSLCGVDGSAAFNGQHGSSGSPASVLAGYKIGVLQ